MGYVTIFRNKNVEPIVYIIHTNFFYVYLIWFLCLLYFDNGFFNYSFFCFRALSRGPGWIACNCGNPLALFITLSTNRPNLWSPSKNFKMRWEPSFNFGTSSSRHSQICESKWLHRHLPP